jgi:hypothetical protein
VTVTVSAVMHSIFVLVQQNNKPDKRS